MGFLVFSILIAVRAVHAQQYHVDEASSTALTKYLHRHRLPLVGAQVRRTDAGVPKVNLYGFVASDADRAEAEIKVQRYLAVKGVLITDSIQINPSIKSGSAATSQGAAPAQNSNQQWNHAMEGIYKDGAQPLPAAGAPGQP
ncbi:MAG: hypothetical protein ACYDC3_14265 [Candidatus Binataceae bacterium]